MTFGDCKGLHCLINREPELSEAILDASTALTATTTIDSSSTMATLLYEELGVQATATVEESE